MSVGVSSVTATTVMQEVVELEDKIGAMGGRLERGA